MAFKKVSAALTTLKDHADDLDPKPSIVFYNFYKTKSVAVIATAKEIDAMIAGTDASGAPALLQTFKTDCGLLFDNLGKVAATDKNKAKLVTLIDTAEKAVSTAVTTEVATFVKSMAGRPRSNASLVDPKDLQALADHVDLRKSGLKEVQAHLLVAQKALADAKVNRQKGAAGLAANQKLLVDLRTAETKVAMGGDFLKGRSALKPEISKRLDLGEGNVKTTVAKLRKEAGDVFDLGMRVMADGRGLRNDVVREVGEHELEVEQASIGNLKDDNEKLSHVKKIDTEVGKLLVSSTKILQKVDETLGWSALEKFTNSTKDEVSYKAKKEETIEAFRALPGLKSTAETLDKRANLVVGQNASPTVTKAVSDVRSRMTGMNGQIKLGLLAYGKFKTQYEKCDKIWAERGGGV